MQETILLIEDNKEYSDGISKELKDKGYNVICAYDGEDGIKRFKNNNADIILLDIFLPKKDGVAVLEEIRSKSNVPIIILTGVNHHLYQKICLNLEADDYVVKPCYPGFLLKKIQSILSQKRNASGVVEVEWIYDKVKVNFAKKSIIKDGQKISLGKTPMEILKILVYNKGNIISRNQIIDYVWGKDVDVNDRTVDTHISKIKKSLGIDCIKSVSGYGYRLDG